MIDEDKIEEAALRYCEVTEANEKETALLVEGFEEGARWAEKEFVKSLWHDGREEPDIKRGILAAIQFEDGVGFWANNGDRDIWALMKLGKRVVYWCYISDILPKEEK